MPLGVHQCVQHKHAAANYSKKKTAANSKTLCKIISFNEISALLENCIMYNQSLYFLLLHYSTMSFSLYLILVHMGSYLICNANDNPDIDCSGFTTKMAQGSLDLSIPCRTSRRRYTALPRSELKPSDDRQMEQLKV